MYKRQILTLSLVLISPATPILEHRLRLVWFNSARITDFPDGTAYREMCIRDSHCIGAKVNHKLVPLSHKLQSGDQVEILTSKSQRVQPQWEVFATTARARAKIAAILRKERKINQKEGEELLNEFLKKEEIRPDNGIIAKLSKLHNMKNE